MSLWRLVIREIAHRKLNFVLSLLSVSVAVGCFVGALRLLQGYEVHTTNILLAQQAEVEAAIDGQRAKVRQAGAELNDAMRQITKGLGFNIFILPETQDLETFHLRGELTETMPESYVGRLSESKLVTINHLLPIVTRRLQWQGPRQEQTLILIGTRGEVPIMHRNPKHPLQDPVEPGNAVVGYHIHSKQGLERGDTRNPSGTGVSNQRSTPQTQLHRRQHGLDQSASGTAITGAGESDPRDHGLGVQLFRPGPGRTDSSRNNRIAARHTGGATQFQGPGPGGSANPGQTVGGNGPRQPD